MRPIKTILVRTLKLPGVTRPFRILTQNCATVFMLHRFHDPERGISGHDPAELRRQLAYLRYHDYALLPLSELFRRLAGEGPPPNRAVAFTIDDGYVDHAEVGAPIFAEFDCPVTTFVTTGFLDGLLWFWWDRIEYIFRRTARREITFELRDQGLHYELDLEHGWNRAQSEITTHCKQVPDTEKLAAITRLADAAEVDLPEQPPHEYAPMSWEQVRAREARGMTFGPHTVTHPILAQASDAQSEAEITVSWERLRAEAVHPVPVFCYPNGQHQDFGSREIGVLRRLGFLGAVVGTPGYANATTFRSNNTAPFRVRRFSYSEHVTDLIQYVTGVERFKQILRRES